MIQSDFYYGSVLNHSEIIRALNRGEIVISPFDERQLNPNSYDFRLGDRIIEVSGHMPDAVMVREVPKKINEADGRSYFDLKPGKCYLAATAEVIGSDIYVPVITGRSTTGRQFISIHETAGSGDLGFHGEWTLEITVKLPTYLWVGQKVGQVLFFTQHGPLDSPKYKGKYQGQRGPTLGKVDTK